MEQIMWDSLRPRTKHVTQSLKLPLYLRVASILFLSSAAVALGARALGLHTEPPPSPLAAFADLLPGQPGSDLEARGFSCQQVHDHTLPGIVEDCSMRLETGLVARVGLLMSKDKIIRYVTFMAGRNALRLGDLMLSLGRPEINRYSRQVIFNWPASGVSAIAYASTDQASPYLPLWSVSFTDPRLQGCGCRF